MQHIGATRKWTKQTKNLSIGYMTLTIASSILSLNISRTKKTTVYFLGIYAVLYERFVTISKKRNHQWIFWTESGLVTSIARVPLSG